MSRHSRWCIAVVVSVGLLLPGGISQAASGVPAVPAGVVADGLSQAAEDGPIEVLVSYDARQAQQTLHDAQDDDPAARSRAERSARSSLARVKSGALRDAKAGVTVQRDYANLPVQLLRVESAAALEQLAAGPGVLSVEPDQMLFSEASQTLDPASITSPAQLNTDWTRLIRQPQAAAAGYDGRGTRVAVVDSGINTTMTAGAIEAFGDCSAGWGQRNCRVDSFTDVAGTGVVSLNDHGTNVAAIVAAVAPRTQLDVYQVFTRQQTQQGQVDFAFASTVLTALDQIAGSAGQRKVKAVNLSLASTSSWNTGLCVSAFGAGLNQVRAIGVIPVISSGNSAFKGGNFQVGIADPACAPNALSVGAVYSANQSMPKSYTSTSTCTDQLPRADQVACFSQTGQNLGLLAPGVDIVAAGFAKTGTSQAAPMVSGAIAAVASAARTADADTLVAALTQSGPLVTDPRTGTTQHRLDLLSTAAGIGAPSPNDLTDVGAGLASGQTLTERQVLVSANREHRLGIGVLGMIEALALTGPSCDAQMLAGLPREADHRLVMQVDGNLVLYDNADTALWATGTEGHPGAFLHLQDDRNLVVYSAQGTPLWASFKYCDTASNHDPATRHLAAHSLSSGQFMLSPDGRRQLLMQGDGNLVLYSPNGAIWHTGTFGNPGAFFVYQADSNLVIYSAAGTPLWSSGTMRPGPGWPSYTTRLVLQSDSNLVLYKSTAGAAWDSRTSGR